MKGNNMAITSEDIQNQSFAIDRKGYDVDEVDVFLEHVASEIDALNGRIADLEGQLAAAPVVAPAAADADALDGATVGIDMAAAPVVADGEYADILAEKDRIIVDLQAQLAEKQANDSAISQALIIAQRSADEIQRQATVQANDTIQDARDEADRILNRANFDRQSVLDAIRKLEDDRENARNNYAELLRDFIDDATAKLNEIGFDSDVDAIPHVEDVEVVYVDEDDAVEDVPEFAAPNLADISASAAPVASVYEKDLSGFGDVEDSFDID
jgi:DivIVA domain-containing protein